MFTDTCFSTWNMVEQQSEMLASEVRAKQLLEQVLEGEDTLLEVVHAVASQIADDERFRCLASETLASAVVGKVLSDLDGGLEDTDYLKFYQAAFSTIESIRSKEAGFFPDEPLHDPLR